MKPLIISALLFSLSFKAIADISLPRIDAPEELVAGDFEEGVITQISPAEIADFLPWAQNAQNQLSRALSTARSIPLRDRLPHIERAVKSVVNLSGSRQYQMFMRFALNRGLLLVSEMSKTMDMTQIGAQENALDLLQRSIQVALSFYESDLSFQNRVQNGNSSVQLSYARFGLSFKSTLYLGVINVLDAKAQYRLMHKLVEMTNWDLSRDAHASTYADSIVEAYELLEDLRDNFPEDARSNLRLIRRLNSLKLLTLSAPLDSNPGSGASSIGTSNSQSGGGATSNQNNTLVDCIRRLSSQTSLTGSGAASYCQRNNDEQFIKCTTELARGAGLSGSGAASVCENSKSDQFISCTKTLARSTSLTGSGAASYCQRNNDEQFVKCTTELSRSAGLSGSGAASVCHDIKTNEFISCATRLASRTSLTGSAAASYCQRDNDEQFVKCTTELSRSAGLSGSGAASVCHDIKTNEFISCATRLASRTSLTGSAAATYCRGNSSESFVSCTLELSRSMSGSGAASTCLR